MKALTRLRAKLSLRAQIVWAMIFVTAVTSFFLGTFSMLESAKIVEGFLRKQLDPVLTQSAEIIDPVVFEALNQPDQMTDSAYLSMQQELGLLQKYSGVDYLFTMKKLQNGDFIYVIDAEPMDSEDFVALGEVEEYYYDFDQVLAGEIVTSLSDDHWGQLLTVYVPIYNGHRIVGMIGASIDASHLFQANQEITRFIILFALGSLALISLFSLWVSKGIADPLKDIEEYAKSMAAGDFTSKLKIEATNEIGRLSKALGKLRDDLGSMISGIVRTSDELSSSSHQASASTEELNASLQQIASTANAFANTVGALNSSSQAMTTLANKITDMAKGGSEAIGEAVYESRKFQTDIANLTKVVTALGTQSAKISGIVETISQISEQTNLLALNAAIEAARAGENGRGFAVVADEVRKLAEQSSQSTLEIGELIKDIQNQTNQVVADMQIRSDQAERNAVVVEETGKTLGDILTAINEVINQFSSIARGIENIGSGSQELAASSEEQSATTEEIAASAQGLDAMAQELKNLTTRFKI